MDSIRIALDLSCVMEAQLTGVGYAAAYQVRAMLSQAEGFDFRFIATRPRHGVNSLRDVAQRFSRRVVLPHAGLMRYYMWSWFDWPPVEWFTGPVDIVHNVSHQAPAVRKALRVVTIHDLSFLRVPETHTKRNIAIQTRLVKESAQRADALIAVSQSCKSELVDILGVEPERIHCVPNGVCVEEFKGEPEDSRLEALKARLGLTRPYLVHLGTVEPRKNIGRLFEAYEKAAARLGADYPQLVLVGKPGWLCDPILESIRAHAAGTRHLKPGDVAYAGYMDRADAIALLKGALACVYPSLYEGFGLPALEAMAAGTPIVASNTTSLPEVVGDAGVLVNPLDTDAIAGAIVEIMNDTETAAARAERGIARAAQFTWENSAAMLLDTYRRLLGAV